MNARRRVTSVAAAVLVCALAAQALVVRRLDRIRQGAPLEEMLYIGSSRLLRGLSLGFRGLMADIYWTRVVQYYGAKRRVRSVNFSLVYPLLEITTDLDPHLLVAYEAGSIFVSQQPPNGAGQPDLAVQLLEKGIRNNPGQWRLYFDLGFVNYMDRSDPAAAAKAFLEGSKVPGAKWWMKVTAAAMQSKASDPATARMLWQQMYETSSDKRVRETARMHIVSLEVDEIVPRLEERVEAYRSQTGRYPANWDEMVQAGYLRGVPMDPTGKPYQLAASGRVEVQVPGDFPFATAGLPPGVKRPKF